MNVIKIISELKQEREQLDQAIRSLERLASMQKLENASSMSMLQTEARKTPDTAKPEAGTLPRTA
jgi:hypothetical protein